MDRRFYVVEMFGPLPATFWDTWGVILMAVSLPVSEVSHQLRCHSAYAAVQPLRHIHRLRLIPTPKTLRESIEADEADHADPHSRSLRGIHPHGTRQHSSEETTNVEHDRE